MTEPAAGILAAIGNTPCIELRRILGSPGPRLWAKLEKFNPGGSIKDRTALSMLQGAIRSGELTPGQSVVVESSSGNLAIGLAQACNYLGLKCICVVDARITSHNLAILAAFGAGVDMVERPDPESGEYLPARIRRVKELVDRIPHAYWPNQYGNILNAVAHFETMSEITGALAGKVDYLFCATSSCGTIRGCAEYVKAHGMNTVVVAVDAVGSGIFTPTTKTERLLPGHGSSIRPDLFQFDMAQEVVHVADVEAVAACRRLLMRESVLAGGSSGATLAAFEKLKERIPRHANCVLIFPDGGERYLDTVFNDQWVSKHLGDVSHLWKDCNEAETVNMPAR